METGDGMEDLHLLICRVCSVQLFVKRLKLDAAWLYQQSFLRLLDASRARKGIDIGVPVSFSVEKSQGISFSVCHNFYHDLLGGAGILVDGCRLKGHH
jgi:hypothetical protein